MTKVPSSSVKIYPKARDQIIGIWKYSCENWGREQADKYVYGLHQFVESMCGKQHIWKPVPHLTFSDAYYCRYKQHYIFFRQLEGGVLGVMSVLHKNMDIPARLLD